MSNKSIRKSGLVPVISGHTAKVVSQYRREQLENEIGNGKIREKGNTGYSSQYSTQGTDAGFVIGSSSLKKYADVSSGGGFRGSGGTLRQIPEIYSPLWLTSNLNLPRDRATINAWSRAYLALNPIVQNAITLHSTYPISKLNITCKNEKIQQFFQDMAEEIGLMNICSQIAQEYWVLGEAFPYAELDESSAKWSRIILQNPDYITVKHSVVAGEPILSLRPDENLKRIVNSKKPVDVQQRQKLHQSVIEHVKRGENIPLSNFYAHPITRKLNPYEVRGTGLIVSCFKNLMLYDKLRECHDEETEVLTKDGFKKISELLEGSNNLDINPNYIVGTSFDDNLNIVKLKEGVEIACFNSETGELEYHKPNEVHISNYEGEMLAFKGKHIDICVTPNHKMWVNKKRGNQYTEYKKVKACEIEPNSIYKLKAWTNWSGKNIKSINVLDFNIPAELYLKFLGHVISEGCIDKSLNKKTGQFRNRVCISQLTKSNDYKEIRSTIECFADKINKRVSSTVAVRGGGFSKHSKKELWAGTITSKKLIDHLISELSVNGKWDSKNKRMPRWVLNLNKKSLLTILNALVAGDGTVTGISSGDSYRYSTASKNLADDVQEAAFKCGYSAFISVSKRETCTEYTVRWSDSMKGSEPIIYNNENQKCGLVKSKQYKGVVWCFDVPTGLFVTRRNNRIAIQGNSKFAQADNMINPLTLVKIGGGEGGYKPQPEDLEEWRQVFENAQYDKDFKIFTHDAVVVERVGYNQGIIDITADIDKLTKEIYMGLMVPQVLMDGGGDVTYANGGITLDVLKQRYLQFRNLMSDWLRTRIFAPISKINDFYEKIDGKKVLVVPEVEWNHMSLFDAGDYIGLLTGLRAANPESPEVSKQTIYRSLGLDFEEENRKIKMEAIQDAINLKEKTALIDYSLAELRTIGVDDIIEEKAESAVPGEEPGGGLPGEIGGEEMGLPGLDSGGPPSMGGPPMPEGGGEGMLPPEGIEG